MIISLHLPKTAGTSFGASLEKHFGDGFVADYGEVLPFKRRHRKRARAIATRLKATLKPPPDDISCVHGHFLAFKYLPLTKMNGAVFVTWVRHPIDRLLSHYSFIQQRYADGKGIEFFHRMVRQNWSFEEFALTPELQNLYSQYLWRTPYETLSFIGLSEHYEEDFAYFCERYLNADLNACQTNVTRKRKKRRSDLSPALTRELEDFHSKDMELYELALRLRKNRISS